MFDLRDLEGAHEVVGAERFDALSVGTQQRDVDIAVEHGAGHQAHGPDGFHVSLHL